jgi:hypothetical protein
LQDSPKFNDEQRLGWQPQNYENLTRLKEVRKEAYEDIDEGFHMYRDWISENSHPKFLGRFSITQLRSNPLFLESTKINENKEEASTSFLTHNINKDSPMYYRSPSLNVTSNLPWQLKAIEFRANPPTRKEMRGFLEKLKKMLGCNLIFDYSMQFLLLYYRL